MPHLGRAQIIIGGFCKRAVAGVHPHILTLRAQAASGLQGPQYVVSRNIIPFTPRCYISNLCVMGQ